MIKHNNFNRKHILVVFGLFLVFLSLFLAFPARNLFTSGDKTVSYDAIQSSVESGECTPKQAEKLAETANTTEVSEKQAELLEDLVNCYLQHSDYAKAATAALDARDAYSKAGLTAQANQMQSAHDSITEMLEFEEGKIIEDTDGPV